MFRGLNSPFEYLCANSFGRIPKNLLRMAGVPVSIFGYRSTRVAGVGQCRRFGLSGEQVYEIGKWKNVTAFMSHYSKLNVWSFAEGALEGLVLTSSSVECIERDWSETVWNSRDVSGNDEEGDTHNRDELNPSSLVVDDE